MKTDAFEQQASRLRAVALKASANAGADADMAQDIAQETMIRLWQMRDDPRLCNPEGYAATIARHLTLNHLRSKQPLPMDERHTAIQSAPSPLDIMIQREEEQWLQQRIRDLPPTQHAVLQLRQVEHRTNSQIAALLGIKETSVSTLRAEDILNQDDHRWSSQTAYQQTNEWQDQLHHYIGISFTYHLDAKKKDDSKN